MINGTRLCREDRRIGYCHCKLHEGFISKKLHDEHQCNEKGCHYFEKFEDAPYWKIKEQQKQDRFDGKQLKKQIEELKTAIYNDVVLWTYKISDFAILSVDFNDNTYIIRCATLRSVNLSHILRKIHEKYGVKTKVVFIENTYYFRKNIIETKRREYPDISNQEV